MRVGKRMATIVVAGLSWVSVVSHAQTYMDSTLRPPATLQPPEKRVVEPMFVKPAPAPRFDAYRHRGAWKPSGLRDLERWQVRLERRLQEARRILENRRRQIAWRHRMRNIASKLERAKRWRSSASVRV